jgi:hypothetical protein
MNDCSVDSGGVRLTSISAAMLVATLAALLAVFALAKPSEAADRYSPPNRARSASAKFR